MVEVQVQDEIPDWARPRSPDRVRYGDGNTQKFAPFEYLPPPYPSCTLHIQNIKKCSTFIEFITRRYGLKDLRLVTNTKPYTSGFCEMNVYYAASLVNTEKGKNNKFGRQNFWYPPGNKFCWIAFEYYRGICMVDGHITTFGVPKPEPEW